MSTETGNLDPATFAAPYIGDGDLRLWQAKYESLLDEYQLIQASLHEVRNNHSVGLTMKRRFICHNCGWQGRESK